MYLRLLHDLDLIFYLFLVIYVFVVFFLFYFVIFVVFLFLFHLILSPVIIVFLFFYLLHFCLFGVFYLILTFIVFSLSLSCFPVSAKLDATPVRKRSVPHFWLARRLAMPETPAAPAVSPGASTLPVPSQHCSATRLPAHRRRASPPERPVASVRSRKSRAPPSNHNPPLSQPQPERVPWEK